MFFSFSNILRSHIHKLRARNMSSFLALVSQILSLKIRDFKEVILVTESPAELNAAEDGELECCVCLSRLEEGNGTRKLACCHLFHRECVDRWLVHCRSTCPLCRLSINCEPMRREMEQTEELMIWFSSYYAPGF